MSDDTPVERGAHTTFECGECGYGIHPGDERVPSAEGAIHAVCDARREARKRYRFFVTPHEDGVSYSLYYIDGRREHPVCYQTGGIGAVSSADPRFGGGPVIRPSEHFFKALGYTFHWLLSYRPLPHDGERIKKEIRDDFPNHYPNGKVPEQEMWAAELLLAQLYRMHRAPPEFAPIVECCDQVTAFRVPEVAEYAE